MESFNEAIELVALAIDAAGVGVIGIGMLVALFRYGRAFAIAPGDAYRNFRQDLGKGILLGLEFLVAADIIRTVAIAPTLENAVTLGIIVAIRTFLSIALEVELEGRWPWHARAER